MHRLLHHVENISACRDREALGVHLVCGLFEVIGNGEVMLLASETGTAGGPLVAVVRTGSDGQVDTGPVPVDAVAGRQLAPLVERAAAAGEALIDDQGGRVLGVFPLRPSAVAGNARFLVVATDRVPAAADIEAMAWLVRIYGNYVGLLDYSEFDSLTNLLNRKTFDEAFDRLLGQTALQAGPLAAAERRLVGGGGAAESWLAVVDVDHFKRVNDTFGHLFGDEVLLRLAGLMRSSFRDQDRLFRFGGEEFVVILKPTGTAQAQAIFERFRHAMESHIFPQVGKVTVSIGFARIHLNDQPSVILDRADQALYWSKEHGRNRIAFYEALIASGDLASPLEIKSDIELF